MGWIKHCPYVRRQHGWMVTGQQTWKLKTGDTEFKSLSDHRLVQVRSQMVCHLPVRILNLLSLFQWFNASLTLKIPSGRGQLSIHYIMITCFWICTHHHRYNSHTMSIVTKTQNQSNPNPPTKPANKTSQNHPKTNQNDPKPATIYPNTTGLLDIWVDGCLWCCMTITLPIMHGIFSPLVLAGSVF